MGFEYKRRDDFSAVVGGITTSVRKIAKALPVMALRSLLKYRTTSPLLLSQGGEPIQIKRSCNLPSFFKEGLGVVACGRKVCDSVISRLQNLPNTCGVITNNRAPLWRKNAHNGARMQVGSVGGVLVPSLGALLGHKKAKQWLGFILAPCGGVVALGSCALIQRYIWHKKLYMS